ncbi:MAG: flagellar biosynthesis protein FlhF [Clostridiales bacterium]|nr:flagellar biosynthesis protein FlhF [Clostridiales bacterium]
MIIKKFQANTEKEAMVLAKEEMGKDAIVMNIKTIAPKGIFKLFRKPLVEITAAVDENVTYKNERPKEETTLPPRRNLNPDIIYEEDEPFEQSKEKAEASSAIEEKLNNLQNLLEKQLNAKETIEVKKPKAPEPNKNIACIQLIYNQLVSNDVDEVYANQIMNEIDGSLKKDSSIDMILASVYQKLVLKLGQPKTIELSNDRPKFIFFIGPTGVGKTTTIAKIASKYKMEHHAKIAFLTADTYRIAAVEQLRTYANILGLPIEVIYTEDDMKQAMDMYADYDIVFVDTAGRSHRNREQRDDLENLLNSVAEDKREIYLVLSATTKYRDLIKMTGVYSDIADYNLIFTKLDETDTVGNIFNIRMLTNAPLSYVTIGQNVPDDIIKIDSQSIAKKLLRGH